MTRKINPVSNKYLGLRKIVYIFKGHSVEKLPDVFILDRDKRAQGHLSRKSFTRKIFKLDSWSSGAGFFPIGTIN